MEEDRKRYPWLVPLWNRYGDEIAAGKVGRSWLVEQAQLSHHKSRILVRWVKEHGSPLERIKKAATAPRPPAVDRIEVDDQSVEPLEVPIEDLIEQRIHAAERKLSKAQAHVKHLELKAEPVGLFIMGDPHVDNAGCSWGELYDHVQLVRKTSGVLAACVGDMQDHWIGRLGRLYANSDVTASEGWRLSEWLFGSMQWIALVGGNHDSWAHSPGMDPYKLLTKKFGVMAYAPDELRITLRWKARPDLEPVVWILRHDFAGRSWFHPTHGPNKEAMLDGRCHILTAGHIHQWGQLSTEQRHERITHAIRVRGYKRNDEFARSKGYSEQQFGAAALIVIDPEAEGPARITTFWDIEQGCDYLTHLRARKPPVGQ